MVEDLFRLNGNSNITIIDNASTYPPLLEWYKEVKNDIKIIRHDANLGCWTFFYSGHHKEHNEKYHIYSDADLLLNPEMPSNWQEVMVECVERYKRKASLALCISDIPDNEFKPKILDHQSICWYPTDEPNVYKAITDMTFTLDLQSAGYRYESVRLTGGFECKHMPWYLDFNNLPEEEIYYLSHLDDKFPEAIWSKLTKEKLLRQE